MIKFLLLFSMALTKKDEVRISILFNEGFSKLILPSLEELLKWKVEVNEKLEKLETLDSSVKSLNKKMDRLIIDTEKKVQNNEKLIGQYYNDYKQDFGKLDKRVQKLELAAA